MKKLMLVLCALFSIHGVFAYKVSVKNLARRPIEFRAKLAACPSTSWRVLSVNSTREEELGGCCLKKVEVRYGSQPLGRLEREQYTPEVSQVILSRQKHSAKGKNTGFGISCKTNKFEVTQEDDGSLKIKRK